MVSRYKKVGFLCIFLLQPTPTQCGITSAAWTMLRFLGGSGKTGIAGFFQKWGQQVALTAATTLVVTELCSQARKLCNFTLFQLRARVYAAESHLPKVVRDSLLSSINKAHFAQDEHSIQHLSEYVSTVLNVPWKTIKKPNTNLKHINETLAKTIYGMKDAKEAILDIIFAYNSGITSKIPPICLIGPPGVGKTAFAVSVANALNLPSVVISATGMAEPDAFFRGFLRTYSGSAPGFFAKSFTTAGCCNPVVVIDEVDKEAKGNSKGTIQNCLLQIFDPVQNNNFRDLYLDLPLDVSQPLYIVTANDRSNIIGPLLDRMIMIEIPNYTEEERVFMANNILWKSINQSHKLSEAKKQLIVAAALEKTAKTRSIRDLKKHLTQAIIRTLRTQ